MSLQRFFSDREWRHGIQQSRDGEDASHGLARGSREGGGLAEILEAFKNMRKSAYAPALMG